jgi:hypothetical protein
MQTNLHPNIQDVSFLCVNMEVLKTTTNSNTNIYNPNTAIRDNVCLLHVSFNSTLESLHCRAQAFAFLSSSSSSISQLLEEFLW